MRRRSLLGMGSVLLAISLVLGALVVRGQVAPWWLFMLLSVPMLWPAVASKRLSMDAPDSMADQLAQTVADQWQNEVRWRGVYDPFPLPVPWAVPDLPVADKWIGVNPSDVRSELPVAGRLNDLADLFSRIPSRRLVIIGPPGSGKTVTAILLILSLLDRRRHGDPIPVLLPLTSWDPSTRSYHGWIVDQLIENYPVFARIVGPAGRSAAEEFLRSGQLVPVLDGFDELPERVRAFALEQLNRELTATDAVVLTSRREEYVEALGSADVLGRAAVIELRPLTQASIVEYLQEAIFDAHASEQVTQLLQEDPGRPLWRVLSSPLMVNLFRTVYSTRVTDPRELLDSVRFPDAATIEKHLLRSLVGAAARSAQPFRTLKRAGPDAEEWLTFLAAHLAYVGQQDFAWWELDQAAPAWVPVGVGALLVGAGVGSAIMTRHGFGPGMIAAIVSVVVASGFGFAVARRCSGSPWIVSFPTRGSGVVYRALLTGLVASMPLALTAAEVVGWVFGADVGVVLWASIGVTAWLAGTTSEQYPVSAHRTLRASRLLAASTWIALGSSLAVVWLLVAHSLAIDGTTIGLVAAAVTSICLIPGSAWGRYTVARLWLAARGRLPWRFLTFLDEMQRAGLLRQTGSSYQFRHSYLRDVLADGSSQLRAGAWLARGGPEP